MPDPTDRLSRMGEVPAGRPLPPQEVRRLGDRRRRRRHAGTVLAASAAVAVVVSGAVAGTQQGDSSPPAAGPATTPSPVEWTTQIPEDFPLGIGLPAPQGDVPAWEESRDPGVPWPGLPCPTDERTFSTVLEADAQRTDAHSIEVDAPARYVARMLAVYPDSTTAQDALTEIREAAGSCGPTEAVPGLTEMRYSVEEVEYGESLGLLLGGAEYSVETGEPTGVGRSMNMLTRVGNALLLTTLSDESDADPLDLGEPRAASLAAATAELADEMCVFAPAPGRCRQP